MLGIIARLRVPHFYSRGETILRGHPADVPLVVINNWLRDSTLAPRKPSKRVKTERMDARNLVRLLRSGDRTPVWVLNKHQEALRDLLRAREDTCQGLLRKRDESEKFLMRFGVMPPDGISTMGLLSRKSRLVYTASTSRSRDEAREDRLQRWWRLLNFWHSSDRLRVKLR